MKRVAVVLGALALLACSKQSSQETSADSPRERPHIRPHLAAFANGDFEIGSVGSMPPSGWTLLNYKNSGVSGTSSAPPATFSALNLSSLGLAVNETYVVGASGMNMSLSDPDLGSGESFRYPIYGSQAARVNYKDATTNGKNQNANVLRQVMTIDLTDVDVLDGQVHVRSAIAPVLENPSHNFSQQPYYFVELLNLTRGTTLYTAFNTAGQTGVPWHNATSVATHNAVQWLDWVLLDIAPGPSALAVGDQVQLTIVGAGCSLGGHFGRVYVDSVAATVPGPYVFATGPTVVNAGNDITYTVNYANGGTAAAAAIGAHVDMTMPPQTTFVSVSGTNTGNCATATVNGSTVLSCPLGTLTPGATGSMTVVVHVSSSASGSIVNGNYSIGAVNAPTLLGPKVTTSVISTSSKSADIAVVKTCNASSLTWGSTAYKCNNKNNCTGTPLFAVTVTNNSSLPLTSTNIPTFTDSLPSTLTNVIWTCAATNAGTGPDSAPTKCRNSSTKTTATGTGNNITLAPRLGAGGGQITINVFAVPTGSGSALISNTASVTAAAGTVDPNMANNSSTASTVIGTIRTLSVTKSGDTASGSVLSAPAGISCGTGTACNPTAGTATFLDGAQVLLTASPIPGATFKGWSGTGAPNACKTTPIPITCSVSMSANTSITAEFAAAPAAGTASNLYLYSGTPQRARTSTAFASPLKVLVTDGAGMPVSGVDVGFTAPDSGASATMGGAITATAATTATGIASVNAVANAAAGTYDVTASVSGLTSVRFHLTNVGDPAGVVYVSGGNTSWDVTDIQEATVGTAYASPLVARVVDVNDEPVPGVVVSYAAPSSGASLSPTTATATTDSNGLSFLYVTANGTAGQFEVTASATGASTTATFDLQNDPTGAYGVFPFSGTPQTASISTTFPSALVAVVSDKAGNSLASQTVTFQVQPSGGASAVLSVTGGTACSSAPVTCMTVVTDQNGLATVNATANATGGSYTVTATVGGVTAPATFVLTNDGGQVIVVSSGSPQTAALNSSFANLVAEVDNADGVTVDGASVTFQVSPSGASLDLTGWSACQAPLNTADYCKVVSTGSGASSGLATTTAKANGVAGTFTVVASTPNAPMTAIFNLANQCTTSTQCDSSKPYCNTTTHACEPCTLDNQCGSGLYCLTSTGTCVACLSDSTCSGTTPICSQANNTCSKCATGDQCVLKSASAPTCQLDGSCTGCTGDGDCSGSTPACLAGACVGCTSNAHCTADTAPICNTSTHTCGPCASDGDCATFANQTACQGNGSCGQCSASNNQACTETSKPYCLTSSAICVTCRTNSDCPVEAPNCFPDDHTCGGCSSDSDCSGGQYCAGGACVPRKDDGKTCADDGECANGRCIASVCCATDCGTCGSCSTGTCLPVAQGTGGCGTYVCDGSATACPTTCAADAGCASGYFCGDGTCTAKLGNGSACTANHQCTNGFCVDGYCCNSGCTSQCQACDVLEHWGTCTTVTGAPHGSRTACASDGTICAGSCDGSSANACSYPGNDIPCRTASCSNGTATRAASCAGTGSCPALQQDSCGVYVCGSNACKTGCTSDADCTSGYLCKAGSCVTAFGISTSVTGGHGTFGCPVAAAQGASPVCTATPDSGYILDGLSDAVGGANATDVSSGIDRHATADASDDTYTIASIQNTHVLTATFKQDLGSGCTDSTACHSTFCADGHCCDTACTGQCQACDVANSLGTCSTVTGAPHGQRTPCTSDGSSCAGSCTADSGTQCSYPTSSTACRAASCSGTTATLAAVCDGSGSCPALTTTSCGHYVCGATACKTGCAGDADCSTGNLCYQGSCASSLTITVTTVGGHGTVTCPTAVAAGSSAQCTIVPDTGYVLDGLTDAAGTGEAVDVTDSVDKHVLDDLSDDTYSIAGMQVDHALNAIFKKHLGNTCSAASQCHSGYCVDDHCCDSACTGQCQACDAQGKPGTCTTVQGAPHGSRQACVGDGSVCAGACDGQSPTSCHYPRGEISCRAPSCNSGIAIPESFCVGTGSCPRQSAVRCDGYECVGAACDTECSATEPCTEYNYCAAGVCNEKKVRGSACTQDAHCLSGFCTDGVCCERACGGQCEACAEPDHLGTCVTVAGPPRNPRTACASDLSTCGGTCDGKTGSACAYPATTTRCRSESCKDGVLTESAFCDGTGACGAVSTIGCGRYTCVSDRCGAECTDSSVCATGNGCIQGACVPAFQVKGNATGHGDLTCDSPVRAGAGATCHIVPEPGFTLVSLTVTPVGGVSKELGGSVKWQGTGDGTFVLDAIDTDYGISAVFRRTDGGACVAGGDCRTGYCVDGFCCNEACTGQCEACDLAGRTGVCSAVAGAPRGGRSACAGDGSVCSGTCDGISRESCALPGNTVTCRSPSCTSGVAILEARCQGAGRCPVEQVQRCGQTVCGPQACLGDCSQDGDCAANNYCSAGICVARRSAGLACATANQCASGFCVDGLCCDQACAGQCQSCDVPDSLGVCKTVAGQQPHGGRPACLGTGVCRGMCDGQRADLCAYPGAATACGDVSCSDGVELSAGACDGQGTCIGAATRDCSPLLCGATACLTACSSAADCISGTICAAGRCVPPVVDASAPERVPEPRPDAGQASPDAPVADASSTKVHAAGDGWKCSIGSALGSRSEKRGSEATSALLVVAALAGLLARRRQR
jgi:hypothetical protein